MTNFNLAAYLKARPEAVTYISDARQAGIDTGKDYTQRYGKDTSGWEQRWVDRANKKYGTSAKDASEFSPDQLARVHFENWGQNTINQKKYKDALASLSEGERRTGDIRGLSDIDEDTRSELVNESLSKQYGGGMSDAELQDFETLIGRLEGSKMRQAAQSNRARQRDTFAGGLASMMGNF